MIRKSLLCLLMSIMLFAGQEVQELDNNFFKIVKSNEIATYVKNLKNTDKFYKNAIEYLTNKNKMATTKITVGDPEDKHKLKDKNILIPNYVDALKMFRISVDKYNNPLSAYIALYIIKTKIPAIKYEEIKYKRKYIELLYKTTNSCSSYIDYADAISYLSLCKSLHLFRSL